MGVSNGQKANETTFNQAFMARNNDTDTSGVVTLKNTADVNSGAQVTNAQRAINELEDTVGMSGEGDANRKVYSSNHVVANGDNRKVSVGKLDAKFAASGGHAHSGVDGDGDNIPGANISGVPLVGVWKVGASNIGALSGQSSTNISSIMGGNSRSSSSTTEGVCVDATYNRAILRNAADDEKIVDSAGRTVYGRITYFSTVWTMFYFVEIAGVETTYTLPANVTIKFYYQYLHKLLVNDVYTEVYSKLAFMESASPLDDVPVMIGDSGSGGQKGLVPAPGSGDAAAGKFLKADGTFAVPAGGGGGGSLRWVEDSGTPQAVTENHDIVYPFQSGLGQTIYARVKVPAAYVSGKQVNLRIPFYSPDSSGTALLQVTATLIRHGTDAITSTTNQHTSSNSALTLTSFTVNIPQSLVLDVTDSTGKINGVSISTDDLILLAVTRGSDTATSDLKVPVYSAEVTFS